MKIGQIPLKIFLLIIVSDAIDAVAQLLMKRGVSHFSINLPFAAGGGPFGSHSPDAIFFWSGVLVYILAFVIWMVVLRDVDLSVALPLSDISYILVPIAAILILHEHVNMFRWVGIACIMFGIYFLSQSKMRKRQDHA